jgi:hypothetical protein
VTVPSNPRRPWGHVAPRCQYQCRRLDLGRAGRRPYSNVVVGLCRCEPLEGAGSSAVAAPAHHYKAQKQADITTPAKEMYSFGVPRAKQSFHVPPPPQDPSLIPTYTTKTTTRIWGANPFQEAVSVTQHECPAALSENAPNENNNVPDRPWCSTLVTPYDPLQAISASRPSNGAEAGHSSTSGAALARFPTRC